MATLTIDAQTALGATRAGKATFALVDANQVPVNGYVTATGSAVVAPDSVAIPSTGTVSVSLVANSLITPANTYWLMTVHGAPEKFLLNKGTGTQTILQCLAEDPSDLVPTLYAELAAQLAGNAEGSTPQGQAVLIPTFEALAAGVCRIAIVGDSILQLSGWGEEVERWLKVRFGEDGELAYKSAGSSIHASTWGTQGSAVTTVAAGVAGFRTTIPAGTSIKNTFTAPTTGLALFYETYVGGGDLLVKRAGVTVATIDTDAAAAGAVYVETTGHASATVEWTLEASGADVRVGVTYPHVGLSTIAHGVQVWQFPHTGYDLDEWLTTTEIMDGLAALAPHLVIVASGTNETTAANVNTMYPAFVAAVRAAIPETTPIAFTIPTAPLGELDTSKAVRAQALALGVGRIEFQQSIGDISSLADPENLSSDNVHPTELGTQALVNSALMVLSGSPLDALAGVTSRQRAAVWRDRANTMSVEVSNFIAPSVTVTNPDGRASAFGANSLTLHPATSGRFTAGDPFALGLPAAAIYAATADAYPQTGSMGSALATLLGLPGSSVVFGPGGATVPTVGMSWDGTGVKITGRIRFGTAANTGWGDPTGTATRTTFATGSVTLSQLAERVRGIIDDLKTCGLLGA